MRNIFVIALFLVVSMTWAAAQQGSGAMGGQAGSQQGAGSQMPGQAGSAGSQMPGQAGAGSQMPGQTGAQGAGQDTGMPGGASATITEGCLGGSNPNFTITDKAGTTYKLNIPPNADASPLNKHVGESVQVMGAVNAKSIDVNKIGRGTSNCPGSGNTQKAPTSK